MSEQQHFVMHAETGYIVTKLTQPTEPPKEPEKVEEKPDGPSSQD